MAICCCTHIPVQHPVTYLPLCVWPALLLAAGASRLGSRLRACTAKYNLHSSLYWYIGRAAAGQVGAADFRNWRVTGFALTFALFCAVARQVSEPAHRLSMGAWQVMACSSSRCISSFNSQPDTRNDHAVLKPCCRWLALNSPTSTYQQPRQLKTACHPCRAIACHASYACF